MNNKFNEKHAAALEVIDPEIADFYEGWLHLRESDDFEAVTNLLAHLAREILEGLRGMVLKEKRVPKHIERTWKDIVDRLERFRHRHKVWDPPYKKEEFNEVWSEFEILLVYIVESNLDFRNIVDHCPFTTLQDSLMRLKTKLDKASTSEWSISNIELSDPQSEINENLQTLAPLLAAFYRDWLRIRQSTNFKCRSYLLGHLAREIASGFKGVLSLKKDENEIRKSLKNEDLGDLREHKPHIASIMSALGVPDFNLRTEQWINISKDFANLAHKDRNEHEKSIRRESESLWPKFEELLAFLVGGYLNLLDRVDKILNTEQPDEDMLGTLHDLLEPEVLYKHFFQNLKSSAWLEPLKKDGWFNPENNPVPQEDPDHSGYYQVPVWYALEYVRKVAAHTKESPCEEKINILVDIVNTIVNDHRNAEERIDNDRTDWRVIRIIGAFPVDRIESRHVDFMHTALNSRWKSSLVCREVAETIFPKFVHNAKKDLTLELLEVILDAKVVNGQIVAVMEYWFKEALKVHGEALGKLCGVEAAEIALTQIRKLIANSAYSFARIQMIEDNPSYSPGENYAELLVKFTSMMFRLTPPDSITETVMDSLQESVSESRDDYANKQSRTIVGLIALNAVKHHYADLKQLFWEWDGNPLNKVRLKPGLYQLIEANCCTFDEQEINQILDWIESLNYYRDRPKIIALRKREWLTALLKTKNERIVSLYKKYKKKNPVEIEHLGCNFGTKIWAGSSSPLTVEELSAMSNTQIAEYLVEFKEPEIIIRWSDPTEEGLARTLKECVVTNPQRFTDDLQPFQDVKNFYQNWILHGFLEAWRDKKKLDWTALLRFFCQILSSERFWAEQHNVSFNYRQWTLLTMADLITSGTEDDKRAFNAQLLPLAERILLILVEKVEPSDFSCINRLSDVLSSNRSKVFSAMVSYALRVAFTNDTTQGNCRWPQAIRENFTRRLNSSVEPSLEFSYTLGAYLPDLSYLDEQWVIDNLTYIFPQQDDFYWQAAFSGYLLYSQIYGDLYSLIKAHGHYRKALTTDFVDDEVVEALAEHICVGWVQDWEILDDDASLIYQLINSGTPEYLSAVIHFFLEQSDKLRESDKPEKVEAYEKVKAKVRPTWRGLFQVFSQNSDVDAYQQVLGPLSGWLGLIDTIDAEVLSWVKESVKHIGKVPGYGLTLSRFIKALLKHAPKTPRAVGEIYLEIPQRIISDLQTEKEDTIETIRILYNDGQEEDANKICNRVTETGVDFLRPLYMEFQHQPFPQSNQNG